MELLEAASEPHIFYESRYDYMKLQVNGTELFFDVVGSGLDAASDFRQKPTMIILHGGPGFDHTYLRPWLDPVSEVAQLVYVDQRGCGRSQRHSHEYYQLGIMADDIVLLCKALDVDRPIVLGQSSHYSLNFISPARIATFIRFSTGARGQTHLSLYAHDGL